jgi:RNA polymerase sigma-70 factor (ECF subfamily)
MSDTSFSDLVRRLRSGDSSAVAEILHRYEAALRMEIRCRLCDPRLRRVFDSIDIVQAVLGSFFLRAAAGQFDLDRPEQLLALLKAMARKKLAHNIRLHQAGCRDVRRLECLGSDGLQAPAADATPSRIVAGRELLAAVQSRLSPEERQLADLRVQGVEWAEVAQRLGGTAGARRKQFARALDRVSRELGLDQRDPLPVS